MTPNFATLAAEKTQQQAICGLAGFAIDPSGSTLVEAYAGKRALEASDGIDENSVFWIYSITKTFVGISVLQCVDRGLIALDDSVHHVLPELEKLQIITGNPDDTFGFHDAKKKITARHLISHTSGIGMDVFNPLLRAWRTSQGEHPKAFCGRSLDAYTLPLLFEPGQGWSYGGSAEWAGILVERLTGMKLGEHMRKYIFEPLEMSSSTFHPDKNHLLSARVVAITQRSSDGSLIPTGNSYPEVTEDDGGAMGLVSSPSDMKKITHDLLQPESKVLSRASVVELFTPQFPEDSKAAQDFAHGAVMFGGLTGEDYDPSKVGQVPGAYYVKSDTTNLPGGTLLMTVIPNLVWFVNRQKGFGGLYASALMPPGDELSRDLTVILMQEAASKVSK